jgi:predicted NAD/FAD-binding protein
MTVTEKGQILTANRLRDGAVVFYTRSGQWSERIDEAVLATEPQAAKALEARGKEEEARTLVTGAYLFEAERDDGHVRALHIRERIRTLGPTVRPDLGKQAEGQGGAFPAILLGV